MKNLKSKIKKTIATGLVSLLGILPQAKAQEAQLPEQKPLAQKAQEQEKKKSFLEELISRFSISASYSFSNADPMKEWYAQLNEDFVTGGKILPTIPPTKEQWKEIQSPKLTSSFGGELGFRLFGDKNLSLHLTGAYETAKASTKYNEVYVRGYSDDPIGIERSEEFDLTKQSIGAKIKKEIVKNLSANIGGSIDFYDVKGNEDMTIRIRGPPDTDETYFQWRKANYEGKGQGWSIETGLEYQILKNLSISASGGIKWGKVKTSGKEIAEGSTTPGFTRTYDYSPTFNLVKRK
jgi:hypothetical protein